MTGRGDLEAALRDEVLRSWDRIGRPGRIAAAFSGGADSTALMHILKSLRDVTGVYLCALHINHALRAEADLEQEHCRQMCESEGIPFYTAKIDMRGRSEEEARALRYAALDQLAGEHTCDCVAAAHHSGDQAELLVMRLMQGSLTGMAGMRERAQLPSGIVSPRYIWRPLLSRTHEELCAYLTERGILWSEDSSNRDTAYLRNYIRLEVIPVLAARQNALAEHLCGIARGIRQILDDQRSMAESFLNVHGRTDCLCPRIDQKAFYDLPLSLRSAVIRLFLEKNGLSPALPENSLRAVMCLDVGRSLDIGKAVFFRSGQYLHLTKRDHEPVMALEQVLSRPFCGDTGDGKRFQAVPRSLLDGLSVRTRRNGDRLIPFGMKHHRKLQDYLTDRGIPAPFRDLIPLLCREDEILWVIGVGPSEACRITSPEDAALLEYTGQLPWD